jgi:cobalamin biosynthetic protein CobC
MARWGEDSLLVSAHTSEHEAALARHGGNLAAARALYPRAPEPWIDLSTGINPHAWRIRGRRAQAARRLPDPADRADLEAAAAVYFGVAPAHVVAVAGAETALRLLPMVLRAARVAIVGPTYGGHAEAWHASGAAVRVLTRDALGRTDADVIVLVNPNNPDGALLAAEQVLACARSQKAKGKWLVVDESFADIAPAMSVAAQADDHLIVLRSFGKFFGLPGLRLGFAIAGEAVLRRLRACIGDWPVSGDAIAVGRAAYRDTAWHMRTRARLARDRARLDRSLEKAGLRLIGGTDLFRLVEAHDAARVFRRLAGLGILVRPFADAPAQLRFGIPAQAAWARVTAALERCA